MCLLTSHVRLGKQFFPKLAGDSRSNVYVPILPLQATSDKFVAPHSHLAYTLRMNKNSIKIIGATLLVLGTGVATVFIFDAVTPERTTELTSTTSKNNPTVSPDTADTVAEVTQAEQVELQRQDVETKVILSKAASALSNYASNNRGALPSTDDELSEFFLSYLLGDELSNAAATITYKLLLNPTEASPAVIAYQPGFVCSKEDSSAAAVAGTKRQFALSTTLPSGSNYCLSS
jgi:hypothetical protein